MKNLLEEFLERKDALLPLLRVFVAGPIDDAQAIAAIRRYQQEHSSDPLAAKSIWLDDSLIRAITGGPVTGMSGIRLYYVRYASGPAIDKYSVIVAVTQDAGSGMHTDKPNHYFDYGQPCPPGCNGGLSF